MNSLNMGIPSHFYIYIALRNKMVKKKKQNATFKRNYMNECLTLIIFFFFFWVFFYFLLFLSPCVNHSASTLKRYWKIMLSSWLPEELKIITVQWAILNLQICNMPINKLGLENLTQNQPSRKNPPFTFIPTQTKKMDAWLY